MNIPISTKVEKAILAALIEELGKAEFVPVQVWDGGEYQTAKDFAAVEAAVYSVDVSTIHFAPVHDQVDWGRRGVMFVCGNGEDCLSDWHTGDKKFAEALERVLTRIDQLNVTA